MNIGFEEAKVIEAKQGRLSVSIVLKCLEMMEEKFQESTEDVEKEIQEEKVNRQKQLESLWGRMMNEYDPSQPDLMEKLNNEWTENDEAEWKDDKFGESWQAAQDVEEMPSTWT
jgi:predicted 3-demethylubiquinone-9 3-methyltransferase (glyoxalase superfamily)